MRAGASAGLFIKIAIQTPVIRSGPKEIPEVCYGCVISEITGAKLQVIMKMPPQGYGVLRVPRISFDFGR